MIVKRLFGVNISDPETREGIHILYREYRGDMMFGLCISILICAAFLAGRISVLYFEEPQQPAFSVTPLAPPQNANGSVLGTIVPLESGVEVKTQIAAVFVASKKGEKYHLPDCPGAKRIAEGNKIFFSSREEAEGAGYTPAANCPGL